jgi:shikimate 5-dehydrogenase
VRFEPDMLDALMRADVVMDCNYGTRSTMHHQLEREIVPGDAMLEAQARASFDFWLSHVEGVA